MDSNNADSIIGAVDNIQFEDIFDISEIQRLQDLFSDTSGVASILIRPDGTPITQPSSYCNLCNNIIRKTEKGLANCFRSSALLGQLNNSSPSILPCLSIGLMDAEASITIDGKHIANWLIGQVRNKDLDENILIQYADEIGANKAEFISAMKEVPSISTLQFKKISNLLFAFTKQLSEKAYLNWQLKKQVVELKKQTAQLIDSEYLFETSQKAAMIGSVKVDFTKGLWVSSEVHDMILGIDKECNRSIHGWLEFIHPDDKEMMAKYMREEVIFKQQPFNKEYRIVRKSDNQTRWVLGLANPGFDSQGNLISFIGIIQDITERKLTEILIQQKNNEIESQIEEYRQINEELNLVNSQLELSEETYRMLFESINDAVFIIEISNQPEFAKYVNVNNIACQRLGYSKEEILTKSPGEINSQKTRPFVSSRIAETIEKGHLIFEAEHLTKEGKAIPVEISAKVFHQNGKTYIHSIARDITERKLIERELILAKEKAEESDRLKTAFLQNMSHEIRTPMNAIIGFSELLVFNFDDKSNLELFTNIIIQRCSDLLVIIDDILHTAKIESGQLPVNLDGCSLNSLFQELKIIFSEQQARLKKQHIQFIIKTSEDPLCSTIVTDKVKLKQIFTNLIGNAFKFTDNGYIEVGCKLDKNKNILFFVSDTGIGIRAEKQRVIFERFMQIEPEENRVYGGTGLGLSIVKGLVELLGGRIWLESESGKGSTFYFKLPLQSAQILEHAPLQIKEENNKRYFLDKTVLIVEDDTYNAAFIKEVLFDIGITILFAKGGREAVKIATTQILDLVLMDIGLPDISGYEAIQLIKQQRPNLKIIVQTAYAAAEDKLKACEAGCVDYISKPIKSQLLISLMNKHLS